MNRKYCESYKIISSIKIFGKRSGEPCFANLLYFFPHLTVQPGCLYMVTSITLYYHLNDFPSFVSSNPLVLDILTIANSFVNSADLNCLGNISLLMRNTFLEVYLLPCLMILLLVVFDPLHVI